MMKRGQAALEFLTTYGWAFLVILVMIGALAYFGVINPQKFLPERCTFQQEMGCKDFLAQKDSSNVDLRFYITNNLGTGVNDLDLYAYSTDEGRSANVSCGTNDLGAGESVEFVCDDVTGSFPTSGKVKFAIYGTYTPVGGKYNKTVNGEIFAELQ
jgi:uncharacterized protein (UPF0333 family)